MSKLQKIEQNKKSVIKFKIYNIYMYINKIYIKAVFNSNINTS